MRKYSWYEALLWAVLGSIFTMFLIILNDSYRSEEICRTYVYMQQTKLDAARGTKRNERVDAYNKFLAATGCTADPKKNYWLDDFLPPLEMPK